MSAAGRENHPVLSHKIHQKHHKMVASSRLFSRYFATVAGELGELAGVLSEAVVGFCGPSPSLIKARESGVILVCQPLSACIFCIAAAVWLSHWPDGVHCMYPALISAVWIWVARSGSIVRWPATAFPFLLLALE